jgi:6-phosphogluconolactonase
VAARFALEVLDDAAALSERAAQWLTAACARADGSEAVALSGGETPRTLYRLLAAPPWRERMAWTRVHWFWGDERFVAHDDPRSNFHMANEAMLSRAPVAPDHIHPVPTRSVTPERAATDYEAELRRVYGRDTFDPARPLFAAVLLGLGENGHTASLFPGSAALHERERWVVPVVGAAPEPRITLTYPALASSATTAFLVAGSAKRAILARLLSADSAIPAAQIEAVGSVHVFADRAAAGRGPD